MSFAIQLSSQLQVRIISTHPPPPPPLLTYFAQVDQDDPSVSRINDAISNLSLSINHKTRKNLLYNYFLAVDLPESFPEFLTSLQKAWPSEASELHMCDLHDFHVSISRTVPIRHHWIEPLKELLQRGFQGKRKYVTTTRVSILGC